MQAISLQHRPKSLTQRQNSYFFMFTVDHFKCFKLIFSHIAPFAICLVCKVFSQSNLCNGSGIVFPLRQSQQLEMIDFRSRMDSYSLIHHISSSVGEHKLLPPISVHHVEDKRKLRRSQRSWRMLLKRRQSSLTVTQTQTQTSNRLDINITTCLTLHRSGNSRSCNLKFPYKYVALSPIFCRAFHFAFAHLQYVDVSADDV